VHNFFVLVLTYPRTVLILLIIPTVFFSLALPRLEKESDVTNMLPSRHATVIESQEIEDRFEIKDSFLVGVVHRGQGGIYSSKALQLLHQVTELLRGMPEIDTGTVRGIFTVDDIVGTAEGFEVVPLLKEIPGSLEDVENLRSRVEHNRMFMGELVSTDGTASLIHADLEHDVDKASFYFRLRDSIAEINVDPEIDVIFAGHPVVAGVIGVFVDQELKQMFPFVGLVVVGMLAGLLRSVRGVVLPLLVVVFGVIWTMGAMVVLGVPIYPLTTAVPIIIMALGCADGIHVVTRFYEALNESAERDKHEIILVTMDEMWSPIVMTSLTTSVGFLSLLASDIAPLRHFGIFSSFGVLVAMLFSLTFLPATLVLSRLPKPRRYSAPMKSAVFDESSSRDLGRKLGEAVYKHRRGILYANSALLLVALSALRFLNADSDPMRYFDPDTEIPLAIRTINDKFNGTGMLCAVFETENPDGFKSPALLRKIEKLEIELEKVEDVGTCISLMDYLKLMNRAMHGDLPSQEVLPATREEIAQYLLLYSLSGDTAEMSHVVDDEFKSVNLMIRQKTLSTARIGTILRRLERWGEKLRREDGIRLKTGGREKMLYVLIEVIVNGQIYSIILSMMGVLGITSVMFRSLRTAILTILPIGVASILNFGIMAIAGLPLEPSSAITSCIGIGVGIDYAIHFISKYRHLARHARPRDFSDDRACTVYGQLTIRTMETAGRAIAFNALVVMFGFLVLLLSNFPPTRNMGIMVSLNMFTSFVGALTLLPAALNGLRPKACGVSWAQDT